MEQESLNDKYAERARKCFESTIHSSRRADTIEAIARALEQAALEALEQARDKLVSHGPKYWMAANQLEEVMGIPKIRLDKLRPEQETSNANK